MTRRKAAGKAIPQMAIALPLETAQDCTHERAIVGLDAFFCPSCRQTFAARSPTYTTLLKRRETQWMNRADS
jgi:hypothetical protein